MTPKSRAILPEVACRSLRRLQEYPNLQAQELVKWYKARHSLPQYLSRRVLAQLGFSRTGDRRTVQKAGRSVLDSAKSVKSQSEIPPNKKEGEQRNSDIPVPPNLLSHPVFQEVFLRVVLAHTGPSGVGNGPGRLTTVHPTTSVFWLAGGRRWQDCRGWK